MRKIIALILIGGFGLIATGAVTIPNTTIDEAIAAMAKEAFTPVGAWAMKSPVVRNVADGISKTFNPVSEGVGEAASAAAGIPQRLVEATRRFPTLARRSGTNAKNSLVPFWQKAAKRPPNIREQYAESADSHRSPLPLFVLTGLFFALTIAKNKRLPLTLLFFCITLSFFYYL